jgi:hypothetical protein
MCPQNHRWDLYSAEGRRTPLGNLAFSLAAILEKPSKPEAGGFTVLLEVKDPEGHR